MRCQNNECQCVCHQQNKQKPFLNFNSEEDFKFALKRFVIETEILENNSFVQQAKKDGNVSSLEITWNNVEKKQIVKVKEYSSEERAEG